MLSENSFQAVAIIPRRFSNFTFWNGLDCKNKWSKFQLFIIFMEVVADYFPRFSLNFTGENWFFRSLCGGPNFAKNLELKNCFLFQIHIKQQKNSGTIKWIQGIQEQVKCRTEELKQALKIILSRIVARAMNCENCQLFFYSSAINISQLRTTCHPSTMTIIL